MARPALEVADIFRDHGPAWRRANVGHVSLGQMKAMAAIESCRTAGLGGHVARCEDCSHTAIAYTVLHRARRRERGGEAMATIPNGDAGFWDPLDLLDRAHKADAPARPEPTREDDRRYLGRRS